MNWRMRVLIRLRGLFERLGNRLYRHGYRWEDPPRFEPLLSSEERLERTRHHLRLAGKYLLVVADQVRRKQRQPSPLGFGTDRD